MELPGLRWGAHGRECLTWGTSFLGRAEVLLDLLLLLKSEKKIFQSDRAKRKMQMFPCSNTTNRTLNLQDELQDLRKSLSLTKGAGKGLKMAHEASFWEGSGFEDGWGEAGAAFLGCHLESKPLTSVPLSLPGPAGSHPMGFSDCFKIPTGALIPDPAASAMMVLSLPVQRGKIPPL